MTRKKNRKISYMHIYEFSAYVLMVQVITNILTPSMVIFVKNKIKKWNYKIAKKYFHLKWKTNSGGIWTLAARLEGNHANHYTTVLI